MVLLRNMLWQDFSITVLFSQKMIFIIKHTSSEVLYFFIPEIIAESVNLIQMSKQKIIINMMENN